FGALLLARRAGLAVAHDMTAGRDRTAAPDPAAASTAAAAEAALNPNTLERFVDPLPIPPIARPVEMRPSPANPRVQLPRYRIAMRECLSKVHRDVPATKQWGYEGSVPGPTIETRSGEGLLVEWASELPTRHLFTIDHRVHGAESDKPEVRTVTHVHGAK